MHATRAVPIVPLPSGQRRICTAIPHFLLCLVRLLLLLRLPCKRRVIGLSLSPFAAAAISAGVELRMGGRWWRRGRALVPGKHMNRGCFCRARIRVGTPARAQVFRLAPYSAPLSFSISVGRSRAGCGRDQRHTRSAAVAIVCILICVCEGHCMRERESECA